MAFCFISLKSKNIYLIDFSCCLPDKLETKASLRTGIGSEACVPLATHELPPDRSLKSSVEEVETVLFTVVKDLFTKHHHGGDHSKRITLFRMGGVAVLLSNKKNDKRTAKYKLKHLVRTNMASDDQAYESVFPRQ
ncbi:hypothetical protein Leryth_017298 [Lithospermum erythrorhizon]|nr:hypothetical protein Leryth_017298 [Lithospermum erythrorhizon]